MHKKMKELQERIYACTQAHVEDASTEELGEAIDMIKDLAEGIYYEQKAKLVEKELECMEENKLMEKLRYRDLDRREGRMYYDGGGRGSGNSGGNSGGNSNSGNSGGNSGTRNYDGGNYRYIPYENDTWEQPYRMDMRDSREGRSPMSRRNYMESKEMHKDKNKKIKDLEKYMQELTEDITEMIADASPEEKAVLDRKVTALASKISALNV